MRIATAIIGAAFVATVFYFVVWFFARNLFAGQGTAIETGGHAAVVLVSLAGGYSSYRASMSR